MFLAHGGCDHAGINETETSKLKAACGRAPGAGHFVWLLGDGCCQQPLCKLRTFQRYGLHLIGTEWLKPDECESVAVMAAGMSAIYCTVPRA